MVDPIWRGAPPRDHSIPARTLSQPSESRLSVSVESGGPLLGQIFRSLNFVSRIRGYFAQRQEKNQIIQNITSLANANPSDSIIDPKTDLKFSQTLKKLSLAELRHVLEGLQSIERTHELRPDSPVSKQAFLTALTDDSVFVRKLLPNLSSLPIEVFYAAVTSTGSDRIAVESYLRGKPFVCSINNPALKALVNYARYVNQAADTVAKLDQHDPSCRHISERNPDRALHAAAMVNWATDLMGDDLSITMKSSLYKVLVQSDIGAEQWGRYLKAIEELKNEQGNYTQPFMSLPEATRTFLNQTQGKLFELIVGSKANRNEQRFSTLLMHEIMQRHTLQNTQILHEQAVGRLLVSADPNGDLSTHVNKSRIAPNEKAFTGECGLRFSLIPTTLADRCFTIRVANPSRASKELSIPIPDWIQTPVDLALFYQGTISSEADLDKKARELQMTPPKEGRALRLEIEDWKTEAEHQLQQTIQEVLHPQSNQPARNLTQLKHQIEKGRLYKREDGRLALTQTPPLMTPDPTLLDLEDLNTLRENMSSRNTCKLTIRGKKVDFTINRHEEHGSELLRLTSTAEDGTQQVDYFRMKPDEDFDQAKRRLSESPLIETHLLYLQGLLIKE